MNIKALAIGYSMAGVSAAYDSSLVSSSDNVTGSDLPNRFVDVLIQATNANVGGMGNTIMQYIVILIFCTLLYLLFKTLRKGWR